MSEGLENRIKEAVSRASDLDGLIKDIKSKRYTYARISRILMQLLCGATKEDIALLDKEHAAYAKVLAFNTTGAQILKEASENGADVISNVNKYQTKSASKRRMLQLDMLSSDVYSIATGRTISIYSDRSVIPTLIVQER